MAKAQKKSTAHPDYGKKMTPVALRAFNARRQTLAAQATRAAEKRRKKNAYERARRAKIRAARALAAQHTWPDFGGAGTHGAPTPQQGAALSGEALFHALQDQVTPEVPQTPANLINQGLGLLRSELEETKAQLALTQQELTKVYNIGFTGGQLKLMVMDLSWAVEMLRTMGIHLPPRVPGHPARGED